MMIVLEQLLRIHVEYVQVVTQIMKLIAVKIVLEYVMA